MPATIASLVKKWRKDASSFASQLGEPEGWLRTVGWRECADQLEARLKELDTELAETISSGDWANQDCKELLEKVRRELLGVDGK